MLCENNLKPGLYVIATPIGNMDDITLRAINTLKQVDTIYCEDTRNSQKLLQHHDIKNKLIACHEHNEESLCTKIAAAIKDQKAVGLISDAGTPLINDPGYKIVKYLQDEKLGVFTVPGPSALTAALSIAGVATDKFSYYGFFPTKKSSQDKIINILKYSTHTYVFYEAPHRILKTLEILKNLPKSKNITLCKELTKIHENTLSGSATDLISHFDTNKDQLKGEFVILISNNKDQKDDDISSTQVNISIPNLLEILNKTLSKKDSSKLASEISGVKSKILYNFLLR